ncbi:MAG TPA: helix-turn-helix transcriptional regulator [Anaerolineales bacterium]
MNTSSQMTLRTKKLGVLIRDARQTARRTPEECAKAMGVSRSVFRSYEEGEHAPSLPELELLAYYLKLPIDHFWGRASLSGEQRAGEPLDTPRLVELRQRMIGALLRQERTNAGVSLKALAEGAGLSAARLKAYELGERPIPLPELETILLSLTSRIEDFFDQSGPIGQWIADEKSMRQFVQLPKDLQAFVCQPVNRPYLDLARKLSTMSNEQLRAVAEGLLDITL